MSDITLQQLLEAGCHFGHKAERWHPKASIFIYTQKDGVHIIDLVKTKSGLDRAVDFVRDVTATGGEVLFVGTKRQAKGIVKKEAQDVEAPYITERWIGGFLTNWEGIHKNLQKIIRLTDEQLHGGWKKFPKHEQVKLGRYLTRLNVFYGGVLKLSVPPQALFIVDIKKENVAVAEAIRANIPVVAIVDTNADPTPIAYPIPANDDAVGSISVLTAAMAKAYKEGKEIRQKELGKEALIAEQQKTEERQQTTENRELNAEEGKIEKKPEEKKKVVKSKKTV